MPKNIKKEDISLGAFVSKRREEIGLSVIGLSKKSGLDIKTLEDIEQGIELFLSSTIRQKLAKGLKLELSDIKQYEVKEDFNFAPEGAIDLLKEQILETRFNKNIELKCPKCGETLITRIAEMYDLEDNLMLHPKAKCPKCPFQIK